MANLPTLPIQILEKIDGEWTIYFTDTCETLPFPDEQSAREAIVKMKEDEKRREDKGACTSDTIKELR